MSKKTLTLLTCLMTCYGIATAQKQEITLLDSVIVTANKFEQKQPMTGKVITIISNEQLKANAGKTIAEILNEQASLYLPGANSNAGSVPTVFMRGASSGRTLILIDGAPVGDPSMINNEFDLNLIPLQSIERIEILKGAQSTLYGSDAIGGVINIITKKNKNRQLAIGLSAGNYGTKNWNIQHQMPLLNGHIAGGFEQQESTGFSSAAQPANATTTYDKDGYNNKSWWLKGHWNLHPTTNIDVYTRKTKYHAAVDYGTWKDDKDEYFNNTTQISGLQLQYKKNNTELHFQYQYTQQDRLYRNDSADKTYTIFEDNHYYGKTHFADAYLAKHFKNIDWIIGTDFRQQSYYETYLSISQWGPWQDRFKDTSQYQNALYTSWVIKNGQFLLELGGRINKHSRYGNNETFTINPSYKINENNRIIASISSGFKAPSLYQLSYNDALKAETSINYELGYEYHTNPLNLRIVYFKRNIDNGLDYDYVKWNYYNILHQNVNGIEFESRWNVNTKNTIQANYTFMDGNEQSQNRITTVEFITYPYLLKRPKNMLHVMWQHQLNNQWSFQLTGKYIDKRYDIGGYMKPDVVLNYYTNVNLHVTYKHSKHLQFFFDGQNLGNDHFQEIYGYNAIGRKWTLGLNWQH